MANTNQSQDTQEFNRVVSGGSFTIENAPQDNTQGNTQDNTNQSQGNTNGKENTNQAKDNTQTQDNANANDTSNNQGSGSGNSTNSNANGNANTSGSGQDSNTNTESKDGSNANADTTSGSQTSGSGKGNQNATTNGNTTSGSGSGNTQGNTDIQSTQSNANTTIGNANANANNATQGNTTNNNPQTQSPTTKNPTIQEKLDKDMEKVDIQLTQEANAKKQEAALNNNTKAPQQLTQADKDRINATLKEAQDALANNAQFIIKVDLSLRAILELILNMRILNDYYVYHADLLKDNKDGIANALIDIETANKRFKLMVEMANNYIQEAIKQMDNANNISLDLRNELEILHDAVQKDLLQTQQDLDIVKTTFEKLQKLEATMGNLDNALKEAELIVEKHSKILQDMKDFINVEMTKAQAELMLKKEEYERDLQATRDLFIERFNELLRELDTKGNTLKTDADTIRFDTINEINTIANNRLAELKKIDIELGANISATKDNALADIQSKYNESLDKLKEQTNNLSNDISTLKTNALQELETKRADSITEITNAKDSTLQEINTLKDTHLQEAESKRQEIENLAQDSINDIESKRQDSITEIDTKINEFNTNVESKTNDFNTNAETHKNEIDSKINNFNADIGNINTNLDSKIKEYNDNAAAKTQEFNTNVDTKLQEVDTKLQDVDTNLESKKQENITQMQSKLDEFNTNVESKTKEFNTNAETRKNEIDSTTTQSLENITNKGDEMAEKVSSQGDKTLGFIKDANDLSNKQVEKNIESMNEAHVQFKTEAGELIKKYIQDIQSTNFKELKDYITGSLTTYSVLSADFTREEFKTSAKWTPPKNVKNIFVYIRGGNGATNATTSGGFSSFGSYISALGGAGNAKANGQYGEGKFAFITLDKETKDINITVAANGGVVEISYYQN